MNKKVILDVISNISTIFGGANIGVGLGQHDVHQIIMGVCFVIIGGIFLYLKLKD